LEEGEFSRLIRSEGQQQQLCLRYGDLNKKFILPSEEACGEGSVETYLGLLVPGVVMTLGWAP
jgi:hypothetical protein